MKLTRILPIAAALLALAAPTSLFAKGGKGKDPAKKAAKEANAAAAAYDTNHDGAITGDEIAPVKKAFDDNKTGPLKAFDVGTDGTLDDKDIAAIQIKKHGKGGKGGKKKKQAA